MAATPTMSRFPRRSQAARPLWRGTRAAPGQSRRAVPASKRACPLADDLDLTDDESAWLCAETAPAELLLREEATRAALGTTPLSMAEREELLLRARQAAGVKVPRWRYL